VIIRFLIQSWSLVRLTGYALSLMGLGCSIAQIREIFTEANDQAKSDA